MPADYIIDKEHGLVISTGWGIFTADDVKAHQDRLAKDPEFQRDFNQLMDFLSVAEIDLDSHMLPFLAARELFSAESRRAFLADNLLILGLARMFVTHRELAGGEERFQIFRNREEAMQWLGVR
jgi:hypothetical protein